MSFSRTPRRNEALMRGFNTRPAAHSFTIAICAEIVVTVGVFVGIAAIALGLIP